jgi:hypothetical protein
VGCNTCSRNKKLPDRGRRISLLAQVSRGISICGIMDIAIISHLWRSDSFVIVRNSIVLGNDRDEAAGVVERRRRKYVD